MTAAGSLLWLTAGLVIMTGMPLSQHLAIVVATGGALALTALVMIWQCRGAVGEWLAASAGRAGR